jgi:methylase of polypeptide subunit release factors
VATEAELRRDFKQRYGRRATPGVLAVEREVCGANVGANGYTTIAQAGRLARVLRLRPGMTLLDVGAGTGWPGVWLAGNYGCEVVLTDLPASALRAARRRARKRRVSRLCRFAIASATQLPFRPRTFDAIVHTDVLC